MTLLLVEMRRAVHRRLVRWMIAADLVFCAAMGVIAFLSRVDPAYPRDHAAILLNWWQPAGGGGLIVIGTSVLVIGAAICGASVAGAEWKAGTITTVLTWSPGRVRLHLTRTASAAILSFVIGVVLLIVFMAAAVPAMLTHGSTSGTDAGWWWALTMAVVRSAGMAALVAVLAFNIATLGRNTAAALVAIAAWALFVENLVRGLRPGLARYLVGENVAMVVPWHPLDDVEFKSTPTAALVTLLVYLAIVVGIATWSFQRRDVAGS